MMKKTEDRSTHLLALGLASAFALGLSACGEQGAETSEQSAGEGADLVVVAPGEGTGEEAGAAETVNLVELTPEFPKPMFIGTPSKAELPNLEAPGDPKLSVAVEEGTELVSGGAEVTGSDDLPTIGELSYVTDGDKEGGDGYYVELGPGLQWVQIDLGEPKDVQAIWVWHYHKAARAYKDMVVQISSDPQFEEDVTTVYNNDHDNSAEMGVGDDPAYIETNHGRVIKVNNAVGRYVRLYSNGNTTDDLNHYVEVEVYGKEPGGEEA